MNNKVNEKKRRPLLQNNLFLKIIALLIGIFLWLFVDIFTNDTREQPVDNILLDMEGQFLDLRETGLVATDFKQTGISVYAVGDTLDVIDLGPDDFEAYLELSSVTEDREYSLRVVVKPVNEKAGYTIKRITPASMRVSFDREISKNFIIGTEVEQLTLKEGFIAGEQTISPAEITITGPQKVIDRISVVKINADNPPNDALDSSYSSVGDIKLLDINDEEVVSDFLSLPESRATLTIPIYKVKQLPVQINVIGAPANFSDSPFALSHDVIEVAASKSAIDRLTALYFEVSIHDLRPDEVFFFDVNKELEQGKIQNLDGVEQISAQLSIPNLGTRMFNAKNIAVKNPPPGYDVTLVTSAVNNVEIIGNEDFIEGLTQDDVLVELDFFDKPLSQITEGRVNMAVNVKVVKEGQAWVVGSYYIVCDLKKSK